MTDRPIIFSAPMVRALLDGRKTQTRRVLCQFNPDRDPPHAGPYIAGHRAATWTDREGTPWRYPGSKGAATGDRLWVRETHYLTDDGESEYAVFAADQGDVDEHLASMQTTMASHPSIDWSKHLRLRPSIHMPRWASRLTLTVTDVRVQRLQDISEADAVAEGIVPVTRRFPPLQGCLNQLRERTMYEWSGGWSVRAADAYAALWNSLHGPGAWDANPWVVALTFDVVRGNIDQMPGAK